MSSEIGAETYLLLEFIANLGIIDTDFGDTLWDEEIGVYWIINE